jgi:hypothetical protein
MQLNLAIARQVKSDTLQCSNARLPCAAGDAFSMHHKVKRNQCNYDRVILKKCNLSEAGLSVSHTSTIK